MVNFGGFKMNLPGGWYDSTHEVEADNPPLTITKQDGVGALQFTVALYTSGKLPNATVRDVHDMLLNFVGDSGPPRDVVLEDEPLPLAACSFDWQGSFVRAWFVTDGSNFAQVTYICEPQAIGPELAEAEAIVRSLTFGD